MTRGFILAHTTRGPHMSSYSDWSKASIWLIRHEALIWAHMRAPDWSKACHKRSTRHKNIRQRGHATHTNTCLISLFSSLTHTHTYLISLFSLHTLSLSYAHTHTNIAFTYIHMYIYTYVHMYICAYIHMCVYTYMHKYIHAYTHIQRLANDELSSTNSLYICICAYMYLCIYV